jgi:hypothetical protein
MEDNNIVETIVKLMEQVDKIIDMTGEEKKVNVMKSSKILLGNEVYERYSYFISQFIDIIISVSRGKKLDLNNVGKKFCC